MSVHQRRDVLGMRLPVVDQLGLADALAGPGSDDVHAEHRTVLLADQLDEPGRLGALSPAMPAGVVGGDLHASVAVLIPSRALVEPDRGDLGGAVGDPRNAA